MPGYLQRIARERVLAMGAEAAHDDRDDLPELEESPFKHILVDLFCGVILCSTNSIKLTLWLWV